MYSQIFVRVLRDARDGDECDVDVAFCSYALFTCAMNKQKQSQPNVTVATEIIACQQTIIAIAQTLSDAFALRLWFFGGGGFAVIASMGSCKVRNNNEFYNNSPILQYYPRSDVK